MASNVRQLPTRLQLKKPHHSGTDGCLYCDNLNPSLKHFPARHVITVNDKRPTVGDICKGFIHCELQFFEAIPTLAAPEVKIVFACNACDYSEAVHFFDYHEQQKPYSALATGELIGLALGKLHIINSDSYMLVGYDGDPNLSTKEQGEKIQILRAECHAILCDVMDRISGELQQAAPDTFTWSCCDKQRTTLISGGRSPEEHHTVLVCDACGQFRVFGDREGKHFSIRFSLYHPNSLIAAGRPLERVRHEEPASPIADLTVKATKAIRHNAANIAATLEAIDNRCMAADGPVTPTISEITPDELKKIYRAAKQIVESVPERIHS